jgi:glycosyltransferase involved in cell wall biosynthesis
VFRNLRCSVIHFNTSWRAGMWTVPVAARLVSRARLVGTMRAMPDPFKSGNRRHFGFLPGLGLWKVAARLVGRTWARALHITVSVNGNDYPQRLVRDFGFDRRKLRVIRNGIRAPQTLTETQRPTEAVEGRSSQRLAGPTRICLLYVGRISPEKGIDHLIRAVADLPEHYSLTIVGDGPSLLQIQSLTEELHVTARVEFVGFVHDPYPRIIASDIVVVPSIWEEAFGRVVIEAMFLMKPVVATRVGGMAEIFVDRLEGVYIPPKDVHALKTAIEELGQDVSLRRRIGERARRRALKDYSISRVAAEYVDTYVSLLKHIRIPARFAAAAIRLSEESTPPFSPNGRSMDG